MGAKLEKAMEAERVEWAVTDKNDIKFQKKMESKQQDEGPSRKAENQRLLEEEEKANSKVVRKGDKKNYKKNQF